MSLCRHYVRELRRSVLVDTPEMEKMGGHGSKRSSMILEQFAMLDDQGPNADPEDKLQRDQHLSAYLRNDGHSPQSSIDSGGSVSSRERRAKRNHRDLLNESPTEKPPRPSFMSSNQHPSDSNDSPAHTVTRVDLRASAEKILYTFLLAGSEREIILPQGILNDIVASIEDDHRDDPEVFDAAKDYTFQAMERDAFPGFLRSKALGNLVPPSMFLRVILGIAGMFGGFWAAFACIFLDLNRTTRCWVRSTHFLS
jgi:hypothetical protein